MSTQQTFGSYSTGELTGVISYYSMTTGDSLMRLDDGSFEGRDGLLKLRLIEDEMQSGEA
ncbi:hypothetical protein [Variovorax sp. J2P1-31]|uniref:hypothetical protein n=1 Tax=Variovorax sp. J2P1-31 TaxID=3053497 RepID=UPI0025760C60|nr:hypothetical protein [Variovorax sp. J2P1-31]MDM0090279.1 hypothetical protein [Variovorax sp. J22G40]MDM0148055.1 hypothetical protein [Variovorax sp. J2P1-31]